MAACAQPSTPPPATSRHPSHLRTGGAPAEPHPLDALTAAEIEAAAKVLRAAPQFPADGLFSTIVLNEPPKSDVLAFKPGAPIDATGVRDRARSPRQQDLRSRGRSQRVARSCRGPKSRACSRRLLQTASTTSCHASSRPTPSGRRRCASAASPTCRHGAGRWLGGRPGRGGAPGRAPDARGHLSRRTARPTSTAGRSKAWSRW